MKVGGGRGEHAGQDETVPWEVIAGSRRAENREDFLGVDDVCSERGRYMAKPGRIPPPAQLKCRVVGGLWVRNEIEGWVCSRAEQDGPDKSKTEEESKGWAIKDGKIP